MKSKDHNWLAKDHNWLALAATKVGDLPQLCWTCHYWLPEIDWDAKPGPKEKQVGHCHRYPPFLLPADATDDPANLHPLTWEGDGCGEWRIALRNAYAASEATKRRASITKHRKGDRK